MKITLNETPQKCNHIIIEYGNKKRIFTKQQLKDPDFLDNKSPTETIIFNKMKNDIINAGASTWPQIKTLIEAKEYDTT